MILSKNIPFRAETFVRRCTDDVMQGRFAPGADDYLEYLIAETGRRYPRLLHYVRVLDRATGKPRFYADADHIVPRSVWGILMFGFLDRGRAGASFNVLSNLFWRDRDWNRKDDHLAIRTILAEARTVRLASPQGLAWRTRWIEIFLRTKRDEGLLFAGDVIDPLVLDEVPADRAHSNWLSRG